ncbi:MAG: CCDC90 family protein [Hyphomicrobium sp.]|nr:CCDC90 family protein [Hyphomicrobium sp.]
MSFDTLSFAKRLTEAGEKPAVAEAHAMALKEFVMDTIATKADLRDLGRSLGEEIQDVRDDIQGCVAKSPMSAPRCGGEFAKVRTEIDGLRGELHQELASFRKEVNERFATKDELRHEIGLLRKDIDAMGLKLTVRMGGMLAVAVGAVATLGKVV